MGFCLEAQAEPSRFRASRQKPIKISRPPPLTPTYTASAVQPSSGGVGTSPVEYMEPTMLIRVEFQSAW